MLTEFYNTAKTDSPFYAMASAKRARLNEQNVKSSEKYRIPSAIWETCGLQERMISAGTMLHFKGDTSGDYPTTSFATFDLMFGGVQYFVQEDITVIQSKSHEERYNSIMNGKEKDTAYFPLSESVSHWCDAHDIKFRGIRKMKTEDIGFDLLNAVSFFINGLNVPGVIHGIHPDREIEFGIHRYNCRCELGDSDDVHTKECHFDMLKTSRIFLGQSQYRKLRRIMYFPDEEERDPNLVSAACAFRPLHFISDKEPAKEILDAIQFRVKVFKWLRNTIRCSSTNILSCFGSQHHKAFEWVSKPAIAELYNLTVHEEEEVPLISIAIQSESIIVKVNFPIKCDFSSLIISKSGATSVPFTMRSVKIAEKSYDKNNLLKPSVVRHYIRKYVKLACHFFAAMAFCHNKT